MTTIKLVLVCLSPILIVMGAIWLIAAILSVDDLRTCPDSPSSGKCQMADAVMAISGGDTEARTREAINLYKKGWALRLIVSGAALDKSGSSNAAAMRQQALRAGVPDTAIVLDEQAADTASNARGLQSIGQRLGLKRVILVTSPYHQRRASLEFNRLLDEGIEIVNHPTAEDRFWPSGHWWLNPYSWYLALGELGKLIYVSLTK